MILECLRMRVVLGRLELRGVIVRQDLEISSCQTGSVGRVVQDGIEEVVEGQGGMVDCNEANVGAAQ